MYHGSCLCGTVAFEVEGELGPAEACHCTECRKWTGHFYVSVDIPRSKLNIQGKENIKWYTCSDKARRGFCTICGSSLFFDPLDRGKHNWIGIALGAFDKPTQTTISLHIFVAEKGDYYEILDGMPQNEH